MKIQQARIGERIQSGDREKIIVLENGKYKLIDLPSKNTP